MLNDLDFLIIFLYLCKKNNIKIMAKFLNTQSISSELKKLITEAKEKIILVSPYLKIHYEIKEHLISKSNDEIMPEITLIYRKYLKEKPDFDWIKDTGNIKVYEKDNLHAKCYINENKAIICSMNLIEYSQDRSIEMGVLITKKDDEEAYHALIKENNNLMINNDGYLFFPSNNANSNKKIEINKTKEEQVVKPKLKVELSLEQEHKFQILKERMSCIYRYEKTSNNLMLSEDEIESIAIIEKLNVDVIKEILPKEKSTLYAEKIIKFIDTPYWYKIGIINKAYHKDSANPYNSVEFLNLFKQETRWFKISFDIPEKGKLIAINHNSTYIEEYFYLDN